MNLNYADITTLPAMVAIAFAFAIAWGIILESSKKKIADSLAYTIWWPRAREPTISMMQNFGYPKEPNDKFPNAVTEAMARDFYAFLIVICTQHFLTALLMLPVFIFGWDESTEAMRLMFVLGTLSDVGFDIYDSVQTTIRTFTKVSIPVPIDTWVVLVVLHHTTAMFLVFPLNLKYIHRPEYHQTAVSLLFAASLCYGAGCYKFALDVFGKKKDLILYKAVVLFQLGIILYTRVYLWFPATLGLRAHLREQNDTSFFYVATVMITIFSIFNLLLLVDGCKAAVKWVPKKFPKTKDEKRSSIRQFRRNSGMDFPALALASPAFEVMRVMKARRKLKRAVHAVIAANRMSSHASSGKDD